ncbi:MAG: hypothetical protein NZ529_09300 [Cytophagaceae bacterium]|nr:hypothetical protein [Cytophagaceae bacterium]MDW8456980.1 hypothetical protein [Cytophagaceae bacterium]
MQIKYTQQFLSKLEDIFSESQYVLRYEKGNFNAGYCLLKETHVAVVNKYFTVEGKINALIEILRLIKINPETLSEKNRKLYLELTQTALSL